MKQSQRLRVIAAPVGADGDVTIYTSVKEIGNASTVIRLAYEALVAARSMAPDTSAIVNRAGGWDIQINVL